jgi:hypothetical protein
MKLIAPTTLRASLIMVACLLVLSLRLPAQSADPLVAVVGPGNTGASGITKSDLKRILLGDRLTWSNGSKIIVLLRPAGNPDRVEVLKQICGMSESLFTRNQMQLAFAGGSVSTIKILGSSAEIKSGLKANPTAVGFLHKHEVDDSVKVIVTLE